MTPHIHCLIPGLIPPVEEAQEWPLPTTTPWLMRWLRRQPPAPAWHDPAEWVHRLLLPGTGPTATAAWQAECQRDPSLKAQYSSPTDGSSLAFLSPVHLQTGIDTAVVMGARYLALSPAECEHIRRDLTAWLAADGLQLLTTTDEHWYLVIPPGSPLGEADLPPLGEALNRSAHQPLEGDTRRDLRRWLTELQMWLYAHPINAARAKLGQPELNSLWLWGRAPCHAARPAYTAAVTTGTLLTDLPSLAGAWPGSANLVKSIHADCLQQIVRTAPSTHLHLVWVEPAYAALEGDFDGWQQAHHTLDALLCALPPAWRRHCTLNLGQGASSLPQWRNLWGALAPKVGQS